MSQILSYRRYLDPLSLYGLAAACVLGLLAVHALAAPPPPVNLGAPGLAVQVRLQHYTDASGTWTDQDPSAITVTDRGTGDYDLNALPTASGTDRYRVTVALAGDPDRALAHFTYGALPGSQVLWVPRIESPEPLTFWAGDDSGTLGLDVLSGLPEAVTDPGTTVTLTVWPELGGAAIIDGAAATIASTFEDATTGTYGATLAYALQPGDLPAAGAITRLTRYHALFELTFPGVPPTSRRLPNAGPLQVLVRPVPGGTP